MNEVELVQKWEAERSVYEAWGRFVTDKISSAISKAIYPTSLPTFLKVPAEPRLKSISSFVDKALYRGKNYADPFGDVTDKVGVRFVVLLTRDIKIVEKVICGSSDWSCSKDKDYEEERRQKPLEFAYQSVHYVVRASRDIPVDAVTVPAEIPCEVQVRTLLQHAHSELTHDSTYKSKRPTSPETQRTVAKSMALIEATDDFFESVLKSLRDASEAERSILDRLSRLYQEKVGHSPESQESNLLIIDAYLDKVEADLEDRLKTLLEEKAYVFEKVATRSATQHLFRQPAILLAYLMASSSPAQAKEKWPLTPEELRPVYTDLGMSLDDT